MKNISQVAFFKMKNDFNKICVERLEMHKHQNHPFSFRSPDSVILSFSTHMFIKRQSPDELQIYLFRYFLLFKRHCFTRLFYKEGLHDPIKKNQGLYLYCLASRVSEFKLETRIGQVNNLFVSFQIHKSQTLFCTLVVVCS